MKVNFVDRKKHEKIGYIYATLENIQVTLYSTGYWVHIIIEMIYKIIKTNGKMLNQQKQEENTRN